MTSFLSTETLADNLQRGDGTFPVLPGQTVPATGYVVAVAGKGWRSDTDRRTLYSWALDAKHDAAWVQGYLGAWTDTETGVRYCDVVRILPSRADALKLADDTGELAIWDLAAGEEIRTLTGQLADIGELLAHNGNV